MGSSYSAEVRITLICDGQHYNVAEIGPETTVLRDTVQLPRGYAQIVLEIDGDRQVQDVIVSCYDEAISELQYA